MAWYQPAPPPTATIPISEINQNKDKRAVIDASKTKNTAHAHAHAHAHGNANGHHGHHPYQGHQWLHNRIRSGLSRPSLDVDRVQARAVGDVVTATINGKIVTWINEYAGPGALPGGPTNIPEVHAPVIGDSRPSVAEKVAKPVSSIKTSSSSAAIATQYVPASAAKATNVPNNWARHAYYNAAAGVAEGITFLNHYGGQDGIPGTAAGGSAFVTLLDFFYFYGSRLK